MNEWEQFPLRGLRDIEAWFKHKKTEEFDSTKAVSPSTTARDHTLTPLTASRSRESLDKRVPDSIAEVTETSDDARMSDMSKAKLLSQIQKNIYF